MAINRACHNNNHNWELFYLLDQPEKEILITITVYKNQRKYIRTYKNQRMYIRI